MSERCKSKNAQGEPCSAAVYRDGYCRWHSPDPELREAVKVSRSKGGQNRSHVARARKRFRGNIQDFAHLQGVLLIAIDDVRNGKMEPGQATAIATLARAIQSLSPVANFDEQLNAMQSEINALKAASAA